MSEQLKPCPMCGSAAHFFRITDIDLREHGGEGICCDSQSCGLTTDLMWSLMEDCKPLLAEKWNRRAASAEAAEQVEVLDTQNHALRQQVKALQKEAYTWSKACEAATTELHRIKPSPEQAAPRQAPLTDWEIDGLKQGPSQSYRQFARAIERAHGISTSPKEGA